MHLYLRMRTTVWCVQKICLKYLRGSRVMHTGSWFSVSLGHACRPWRLWSSCNINKYSVFIFSAKFLVVRRLHVCTGRKKTAGRAGQQTNQMSNLYMWTCCLTSAMTSVMMCGTDSQLPTTQHSPAAGTLSLSGSFSFHARFSSFIYHLHYFGARRFIDCDFSSLQTNQFNK